MTVVVAGEALIDLIPTTTGELGVHPGGGPFNTARWLGRLGPRTAFLGAIATDMLGQRLRDSLRDAGVDLGLVVDTDHPTTLALAQLDSVGVARYSFYADATSVRALTPGAVRANLPNSLTALIAGGVALALEPSAAAIEEAVTLAHACGALVLLDPNIRPALIPDRADYMRRFERVLAHTHILKLSVEDLAWLTVGPDPGTDMAAPSHGHVAALRHGHLAALRHGHAADLMRWGPEVVLVTDGAEGATVHTSAGAERIPARPVEVADTIGAGDAFNAGFLASWSRNHLSPADLVGASCELIEAARYAVDVAAVACAHRGATPPAYDASLLPEAS